MIKIHMQEGYWVVLTFVSAHVETIYLQTRFDGMIRAFLSFYVCDVILMEFISSLYVFLL